MLYSRTLFSGGSLVKVLSKGLPKHTADWAKWKVFFCDERHVPYTDKECSYGDYKANLLTAVAIPENNLYPIQPDITGKSYVFCCHYSHVSLSVQMYSLV